MKPLALQILVESRSIAVPSRHVLLLCSAADARAIAEPASKAATSLSCFEQARGLVPDTLSCATKLQEAGDSHEGSIVVQRVKALTGEEGFNAQTGVYENLVTAGVIDPTKVVRSALQNAASIAALLLTTEAVVAQMAEPVEHSH